MPGEHGGHRLLDHPADLRLGQVPPQGRQHRQGVNDVAQGAGAERSEDARGRLAPLPVICAPAAAL